MKQTLREWLRENENNSQSKEFKDIKEKLYVFESFDTHCEIEKMYRDERQRLCSNFRINNYIFRVFIQELFGNMIHIGFEKRDRFFSNKWSTTGIENILLPGEIQRLFGTVIYVVNKLYTSDFIYITITASELKKFNLYLRIIQQISNKLLPDSIVSFEDDIILITKKGAKSFGAEDIKAEIKKKK